MPTAWATFLIDSNGSCTRVTGLDFGKDWEVGNEFSLSFLEEVAMAQEKNPSVVE